MEKHYKICQSCSMPLKKSPNGGGTNADGSLSHEYCSNCYQNGAFTKPDWNVKQMRTFVKSKMRAMGIPGLLAGIMTRGIKRLERWKKH
jgi:hypothetical protein